jgi:hypothetical protein
MIRLPDGSWARTFRASWSHRSSARRSIHPRSGGRQETAARRTAEKALTAVIQEAYVHGVSTRAVDDLGKAVGGTGVSKSRVSRLCDDIDDASHQVGQSAMLEPQAVNIRIAGLKPRQWVGLETEVDRRS